MKDLIGSTWQKQECFELGITIEEHNAIIEAAVQAVDPGDSAFDAYQNLTNEIRDSWQISTKKDQEKQYDFSGIYNELQAIGINLASEGYKEIDIGVEVGHLSPRLTFRLYYFPPDGKPVFKCGYEFSNIDEIKKVNPISKIVTGKFLSFLRDYNATPNRP